MQMQPTLDREGGEDGDGPAGPSRGDAEAKEHNPERRMNRSVLLTRPDVQTVPVNYDWKSDLDDAQRRQAKLLKEQRASFSSLPCSAEPYVGLSGELHAQEMASFCAAGVLIWRQGATEPEVLMVWEDRYEGRSVVRKLNFLGGRRDRSDETPNIVAAREVSEETGGLMSASTIQNIRTASSANPVLWCPRSKYALIAHELVEPEDLDVAAKFGRLPRPPKGGPLGLMSGDSSIIALAWVPVAALVQARKFMFAEFARVMIRYAVDLAMLPWEKAREPEPGTAIAEAEADSACDWDEVCETFDGMHLRDDLLRGIRACGFEKPMAIQQCAILPLVAGRDAIVQGQPGGGKTVAFCISCLHGVDTSRKPCQALLLASSRELAVHIHRVLLALGGLMQTQCHLCVGGTNVREDKRRLEAGVQVVTGTPGRVHDMINRGALCTDAVKVFVLDEADVMVSLDFRDQICDIFKRLPPTVQVALFGATVPAGVLALMRHFQRNPVRVRARNDELTLEGLTQFYVVVAKSGGAPRSKTLECSKPQLLCDLHDRMLGTKKSIVFVNSRKTADKLCDAMKTRGFSVSAMHGRTPADGRFKPCEVRCCSSQVLITTKFLDALVEQPEASLLINYDLPTSSESYIHRIGRSGKSTTIHFVGRGDEHKVHAFVQLFHGTAEEMPLSQIQMQPTLDREGGEDGDGLAGPGPSRGDDEAKAVIVSDSMP